jgi:outer membrane protein assembly factor BamB
MSNRKSLVAMAAALFLLALGSGLVLAYQAPVAPGTAAGPPADAAATVALEGWPILRHDNGHTGLNSAVGVFRPPLVLSDTIELEEPTGEAFQILSMVTGPQRIYAAANSVLYGVDKANPADQWRNDDCISDPSTRFCFLSYLAYTSDRLVVVKQNILPTSDFELAVLNAATGQEIWSRSLGATAPEVALEGSDILVLSEGQTGGLLIRLELSGRQVYQRLADIRGFPDGRAVVAGGRFVYANDDRLLAYDTFDGDPAWVYTDTARVDTTTGYDLVATAEAVIASQGERVIKLATANGIFAWETDIAPVVCNSNLRPNSAATDGTTIAVTGVCDEEVVGLRFSDGGEEWRVNIGPQPSPSAIAIGGDVLYVASVPTPEFHIYGLDLATGAQLQKLVQEVGESSSVLVISDGLLLTASDLGSRLIKRFERTPADVGAMLLAETAPICGPTVGGTVTFEFEVTNHGPGTTDNTTADLILPSGVATIDASSGTCTGGAGPYCDLGSLAVGESVRVTATVEVDTAGSYAPGIRISGPVRDPNDLNDSASTTLVVNPAVPANLDLQLTDIEITQGIQNLANDIGLVAFKPTMVRLYGQTNGDAVGNVSAVLHGTELGSGEDLGTLTPLPQTGCPTLDGDTPDRNQLSESWVFQLPPEWWSGEVEFTGEVNAGGAIPETDAGNNTLSITRGYLQHPLICVMTYPVRTKGTPAGSSTWTDNLYPDDLTLARDDGNLLSRALTMLPTKRIKVFANSHLIEEYEPFSSLRGYGPYELTDDENDMGWIIHTLWWINAFTDDPDICDISESVTHYAGMIDPGSDNTSGSTGRGYRPGYELTAVMGKGPAGSQAFDDPQGSRTLAHELGHNYGRKHVDCGSPRPKNPDPFYPQDRDPCNFAPNDPRSYYGLDIITPTNPVVITPTMAGDLMSYARDKWTSEYTWYSIQKKMCEEIGACWPTTAAAADLSPQADPITGDVLLVRGRISPTLTLDDLYRLPVTEVPKAQDLWAAQVLSRPLTATYALNLISSTLVLYSEPFSPTESSDQVTDEPAFGLVIPWDPATTRIELTAGGSTVVSRTVSASAPEVTALSPDGGETYTDTLPISWAALDPDGDELRYTVLYSSDNGATWHALASGTQTTTLTVDSSLLPGSAGQGRVKVIASDGLNSTSRTSAGGFTIPNRAPLPFIYFPDDEGLYPSGSDLILSGAVYDPEDGYLAPEALSWSVSGLGTVGSGEALMLSGLTDGEYTLTLNASDSNAQGGSTSVTFQIGELPIVHRVYLPVILEK